jgi:hypothetical protein
MRKRQDLRFGVILVSESVTKKLALFDFIIQEKVSWQFGKAAVMWRVLLKSLVKEQVLIQSMPRRLAIKHVKSIADKVKVK